MHDRKIEKRKYNRFFIRTLHLYKIKFDMKAIVLYYSHKGKTARFDNGKFNPHVCRGVACCASGQ